MRVRELLQGLTNLAYVEEIMQLVLACPFVRKHWSGANLI